jgi:hypothetical protein
VEVVYEPPKPWFWKLTASKSLKPPPPLPVLAQSRHDHQTATAVPPQIQRRPDGDGKGNNDDDDDDDDDMELSAFIMTSHDSSSSVTGEAFLQQQTTMDGEILSSCGHFEMLPEIDFNGGASFDTGSGSGSGSGNNSSDLVAAGRGVDGSVDGGSVSRAGSDAPSVLLPLSPSSASSLPPVATSSSSSSTASSTFSSSAVWYGGARELAWRELSLGPIVGEGSFGFVRKGKWRSMEVAIKTMKSSHTSIVGVVGGVGGVGVGIKRAVAGAGAVSHGDGRGGLENGKGLTNGTDSANGDDGDNAHEDELLRTQEAAMEAQATELRHEAAMLARVCHHEFVVEFVGIVPDKLAVVMRFMPNGSLQVCEEDAWA